MNPKAGDARVKGLSCRISRKRDRVNMGLAIGAVRGELESSGGSRPA